MILDYFKEVKETIAAFSHIIMDTSVVEKTCSDEKGYIGGELIFIGYRFRLGPTKRYKPMRFIKAVARMCVWCNFVRHNTVMDSLSDGRVEEMDD